MERRHNVKKICKDQTETKLLCYTHRNRVFPSFKSPHFQNEAKCKIFLEKMTFIWLRVRNDFLVKGIALIRALKHRHEASRK